MLISYLVFWVSFEGDGGHAFRTANVKAANRNCTKIAFTFDRFDPGVELGPTVNVIT